MPTSLRYPLPHFSLLRDLQLEVLRLEPKKKISFSRSKNKLGHTEKQFDLESIANPQRTYRLFIRQSLSNPAVFSVGLTLISVAGDLILCRYNSDHHGHKNILEKVKLPPCFHCHKATERYIAAELDVDGYAEIRNDYSSIEGALACMVRDCNISGILTSTSQDDFFK